jgi:hypothetical protein
MDEALISGWLERDLNPFFLFAPDGRVRFINPAAELLLGYASPSLFFDLARRHGGQGGYQLEFAPLSFESFHFYGVLAGEDASGVGIRLYQTPLRGGEGRPLESQAKANIYRIIDANIAAFKARTGCAVVCDYDPALPPVRLLQNDFSRLMGKSLEGFAASHKPVQLSLKIAAGVQRTLLGRRWPVAFLQFSGDHRSDRGDQTLLKLAESMWVRVALKPDALHYELVLVN